MKRRLEYATRYGLKPGTKLRPYQRKAAATGLKHDSVALLMDPRLGKTRVDIAISGARFKRGEVHRWVIVCPSVARETWAEEIEKVLDIPYEIRILYGKAEDRKMMMRQWKSDPGILSIMILNHEATWRVKKWLYKSNPCRITLDESHRIKNRSAKQSRTMHTLASRAKYRSILTGTLMATPVDVFSQYKFLDSGIFGTRYADFEAEYVKTFGYGGYKPKTFKNLEALQEKIKSCAFSLTRKEAGGFPDEYYQNIYFSLGNVARGHYDEMQEHLFTTVQGERVTASIILTQILRLQQITGGFLTTTDPEKGTIGHAISNDRQAALLELLHEYPTDTPLVIFVRFRYELDAVMKMLKSMGRSASSIMGGDENRDQVRRDFMAGKVDTCVVQIRAGGVGIELSRAHTAIFYSITHSLIDYEQAKARIIAAGNHRVAILHLVARDTIDEEILAALETKVEVAQLIRKKFK